MVLHGGNDGQLAKYGFPDEFVFDWTQAELETLDIGDGERIPTFEELLNLIHNAPDMLINIEMKCPISEDIKQLYNHGLACEIVSECINRHGIEARTIISSFEPLITNKMKLTQNR